jgi:hypothetical protein
MVNDPVNRVAEKFETGDECQIELAGAQQCTKSGRMIEPNLAGPPMDERTRVEVFDAADPQGFQRER